MNDTAVLMGLSIRDIKDTIQMVLWIITAIGVLVAAFKALIELRHQREQRERETNQRKAEYRWRQAELAKTILDDIRGDENVENAMIMLDWTNRPFEVASDTICRITQKDIDKALRTTELEFDEKETFIRDCFDAMLDAYERLEHYIDIGLLLFEDVEYPIAYYVEELSGKRPIIDGYMNDYGYEKVKDLFNRFDFWREGKDRSRKSCVWLTAE